MSNYLLQASYFPGCTMGGGAEESGEPMKLALEKMGVKLYELEGMLTGSDFLRISKSVIVNLSKIQKLIPALSGRFEAVLMNDLKVIISRQYVNELKKRLGI